MSLPTRYIGFAAKRLWVSSASQGTYKIAPRESDLAPLADLWVASWQATLPAIDFAARSAWFSTHLREIEDRGGVTLCAYSDAGPLVGFILLDPARKRLEQIAVHPAAFGSGLGAFLLDHAKQILGPGLSLEVNADNPRALRFYEKHGFLRESQGVNPHSGLPIWHLSWPG